MTDASGMERVPFDGRTPAPTSRSRRRQIEGHGPGCSPNPEVGCVCGEDERASLRAEAREARLYPNAAAEGIVGATPWGPAAALHDARVAATPNDLGRCFP